MPGSVKSVVEPFEVALVMLSNFGPADGGRETWAYNFIPRLIARHKHLRLSIFGLRIEGEPDNSTLLETSVGQNDLPLDLIIAPGPTCLTHSTSGRACAASKAGSVTCWQLDPLSS